MHTENEETILCKWCSEPTKFTGTAMCNNCWEMSHRIMFNLDLAKKMIAFYEAKQKKLN